MTRHRSAALLAFTGLALLILTAAAGTTPLTSGLAGAWAASALAWTVRHIRIELNTPVTPSDIAGRHHQEHHHHG